MTETEELYFKLSDEDRAALSDEERIAIRKQINIENQRIDSGAKFLSVVTVILIVLGQMYFGSHVDLRTRDAMMDVYEDVYDDR